jgi:hypothetical protein
VRQLLAITEWSAFPAGQTGVHTQWLNLSPRVGVAWDVTMERQLRSNLAVSARYLGSDSDHLWWTQGLNPGVFLGVGPCALQGVSYIVCSTAGNIAARRLLPLSGANPASAQTIGIVDLITGIGSQDCHGLRLACQRRSPRGFSLTPSRAVLAQTPPAGFRKRPAHGSGSLA